ncbi:4Fe-4S binding protein [Hominifimenecus sp. rT4P-3]|uniref:4Fe-4S binding protein n=1 Tax=Hominifimenecus sp. rT4P-3 TaxID=3242979 RepID=UPI003DA66D44
MSKKACINKEWCKSCGYCVVQCPKQALKIGEELNTAGYRYVALEEDKCIGCGICYSVCPDMVFRIVETDAE